MAPMTELINSEPSSFAKAAQHDVWQEAMVEEYDSIMKNKVWEVVPRPEGKKVVGSRWIYKVKHAADGSVEKYKARFMAKGFSPMFHRVSRARERGSKETHKGDVWNPPQILGKFWENGGMSES